MLFIQVEQFLLHYCCSTKPILLALSGGSDSLCLFYALIYLRQKHNIAFHIAHVDHRWRQESQKEAEILKQLALDYQVPFHLKNLNPSLLLGNLEAACREERYSFFAELNREFSFQAVLTGHHQDDQAETVLKRILEGAHWSHWKGLQMESWIKEMRLLRPLLYVTKKEIQHALNQEKIEAFDDPTNRHLKFLRARLREKIFPYLNQEFGKQVQKNLVILSKEVQELNEYFEERLALLLENKITGPWGTYLDLNHKVPLKHVEIKFLLKRLSQSDGFFLSREMIEQISNSLQLNKANQIFIISDKQIRIDRQKIFILTINDHLEWIEPLYHRHITINNWSLKIYESNFSLDYELSSWKEGWIGKLKAYLPQDNDYCIGFKKTKHAINIKEVKKQWSQAKVPAFLYSYFPLIWKEENIKHEFLTGKSLFNLQRGESCWKIELDYLKKPLTN